MKRFTTKFLLSIKWRILLTFSLLSCGAIYLFHLSVSDAARRHYLEATELTMLDQLVHLRALVSEENTQINFAALERYCKGIEQDFPKAKVYEQQKEYSDQSIYLTDLNGNVIFHSRDKTQLNLDYNIWRNVRLALQGKYGARATRWDKDDPSTSVLHTTFPLATGDRIYGTITLAKPVKHLSLYLNQARNRMLKVAVLTLFLLLLTGVLLMRRIVNPISKLTKYVADLSEGIKRDPPKLPRGELQILANTIQDLRQSLDGKAYVESYVQSLTHELKSPIAAISGAVELLDMPGDSTNCRLLTNISRESSRMNEMVQQLLLLSRLENKARDCEFVKFEWKDFLQELCREAGQRLAPQNIEFESDLEQPLKFKGDLFLLKMALNNLLQNASEFSENDSAIKVKLSSYEKSICIEILDSGSGIPDYAQERIFERFYSLPRPKSGAKSSGLGLAIVAEIVEMHKGHLDVKNRVDSQGVIASVVFPL